MRQTQVKVEGKEYTLQHPGAYWYLEMKDRCKNANGVLMESKYTREMLDNVVVQPQVTPEDFGEDIIALTTLVNEAENFLGSQPDKSSKTQKEG